MTEVPHWVVGRIKSVNGHTALERLTASAQYTLAALIAVLTVRAVTTVTSIHTAQPYVCLLKPCVAVSSVFWQNTPSRALGESGFSQPPRSSCQCGCEERPASGGPMHFLRQCEWCDLSRMSLFS